VIRARRIGNEYLFQERAKENVEVLKRYNVRKIIASWPALLQHIRQRVTAIRRRSTRSSITTQLDRTAC